MGEDFEQQAIRKGRRRDHVGESARQSRKIGAEPRQAVLADNRHRFSLRQAKRIESQQDFLHDSPEIAPGNLFEAGASLQLDKRSVTELLHPLKENLT
jgi:hypothetical protein